MAELEAAPQQRRWRGRPREGGAEEAVEEAARERGGGGGREAACGGGGGRARGGEAHGGGSRIGKKKIRYKRAGGAAVGCGGGLEKPHLDRWEVPPPATGHGPSSCAQPAGCQSARPRAKAHRHVATVRRTDRTKGAGLQGCLVLQNFAPRPIEYLRYI